MEMRIYHGELAPEEIAQGLIAQFNRGNLIAQKVGSDEQIVVQIATRRHPMSGGRTALTIVLRKVEDGVAVQVGKQAWLGVAASLGTTALAALRNPFNLLGRLDDLAQDIEHLQLSETVWDQVEKIARIAGASHSLSDRLRTLECAYCATANPVAEPNCVACGAPLGDVQPRTCPTCGFVVMTAETNCPNCRNPLSRD
jgi:hypothetical protein